MAVAFLLSIGGTANASFPFNSDPADCPTIAIGNHTTGVGVPSNGGPGCQTWSQSRVQAQAGDTINVHIYYHNTSSAPATNVKVNLVQSNTGPSTSFSLTGTLASGQGNTPMGPVTVDINTAQTLTFLDLVWYPNQSAGTTSPTPTSLPGGQNGSQIMSGGVDIGIVSNTKPGYQGNFVAVFRVGNSGGGTTSCSANIYANPQTVNSGDSVALSWTSTGANTVTVDGVTYSGSQATSGSTTVRPTSSRPYTIVANCNGGSQATDSVNVAVNNIQNNFCEVYDFSASPNRVIYSGQTVSLYWDTVDADYVIVDGTRYNTSSGYKSVRPTRDTTYRMTAYCNDGTRIDRDVRVTVDYADDYEDLTLRTNRATNITTNSATLNGYIDANGNNATRWFRYGTTSSTMYLTTNIVNHGTGAKNVSDSVYSLVPNTTYYYQVVASDSQGTHNEANIEQFHTNASFITPSGSTSAVTTIATGVSRTGAQLNGLLLNTSSYATSTYFEYGTDVIMNNRTVSKAMGTGTSLPLSDYITGLAPNTTYYFRANAENANGRVFGSIETFRTLGNAVVVPPTVITRVGTASPIMLKVENRYQCFNNGNTVDYTVTYQNIGSTTLTNPLLQVVLPVHVAFGNTSRGTYAPSTHTVSIPLENLAPNQGGVIYVQGQVVSLPVNNSEIVTTALLAYTNSNGAQENAMAYVLNNQCFENNVLGASAFFAGGFWPTTLCGWLLLIIILILIVLLVRWLLAGRDERNRLRYTTTTTRTTDHL